MNKYRVELAWHAQAYIKYAQRIPCEICVRMCSIDIIYLQIRLTLITPIGLWPGQLIFYEHKLL